MKKILVTGGAGFIGSNLCEKLISNSDCEVYSLDNYSTGTIKNHIHGVKYIKGSSADINKLIKIEPDIIYHLGEYSRVEQSFEEIEKVWEYNIRGTYEVLQFCRKTGAKLIYAGSSTKFADGGIGRSQSPYAWTKATNTELVENYGNWYNIEYAIVYFYNVYGKREISTGKYATLIAIFQEKYKNGEPLPVIKPGIQIRNFTHIDDIVNGLIIVGESGYGDGFGIGNPKSYSILEIAKMFGGDIQMLPERKGNRMMGEVETTKSEALGWKSSISISTYIEEFKLNILNKII
jgi:UDP-glucose 4-epimerase